MEGVIAFYLIFLCLQVMTYSQCFLPSRSFFLLSPSALIFSYQHFASVCNFKLLFFVKYLPLLPEKIWVDFEQTENEEVRVLQTRID